MRGRGRVKRGLRVTAAVAGAVVLVLVMTPMVLVPAASPRGLVAGLLEAGVPSFYAIPSSTPAAPPGTLVRAQELLSAPAGSRAWRVA